MKISWTVSEISNVQDKNKHKTKSMGHIKAKAIVIVRDTSLWPDFHSYRISWRYPKQLKSYWLNKTENYTKKHQKTKGHNSETEKQRVTLIICDTWSWLDTHSYKVSWRYNNSYWVMARTRFFKDFQRAITQKLRKRVQSFLCMTHCLDLIYISIKYHEDFFCLRTDNRQTDKRRDSASQNMSGFI